MNKNLSTREIILTELKRRGRLRSSELAEELKVTTMAIFQHFQQLEEEGAVSCVSIAKGRGRPVKYWELTEKSDTYFPDSHRDLSLDLIDSIRESLGEAALDTLIDHRAIKQQHIYQTAIAGGNDLKTKLKELARQRSHEGYMAEVLPAETESSLVTNTSKTEPATRKNDQTSDDSFILAENHCPICDAAKVCSGLCSKELDIFQSLFKEIATVERTEHKLAGARRCAYKVTPVKTNT
jgi:predicted ArsR family transcriptional regulator